MAGTARSVDRLINRSALLKLAERKISDAGQKAPQSALIICDVAPLTGMDSMLGDEVRDQVAVATAQRLTRFANGRFEVARIGRLTFALWVDQAPDPARGSRSCKGVHRTARGADKPGRHHLHTAGDGRHRIELLRRRHTGRPDAQAQRSPLHTAQEQGAPGYGFFNPEIAKDMRRQAAVQRAVPLRQPS